MKSYHSASELEIYLRHGAALGLNLAATRAQAKSVPKTPLEYGDLRDSLVVSEATPDDLQASVSSDLPYAVPQHERLDFHHDDGEAKYLERGTLENVGEYEKIIGAAVKGVMQK